VGRILLVVHHSPSNPHHSLLLDLTTLLVSLSLFCIASPRLRFGFDSGPVGFFGLIPIQALSTHGLALSPFRPQPDSAVKTTRPFSPTPAPSPTRLHQESLLPQPGPQCTLEPTRIPSAFWQDTFPPVHLASSLQPEPRQPPLSPWHLQYTGPCRFISWVSIIA
jgi:hypothetical protein